MNQQENQIPTNQAVKVEDLTVEEAVQQQVKGGNRDTQTTYAGPVTLTTNTSIG